MLIIISIFLCHLLISEVGFFGFTKLYFSKLWEWEAPQVILLFLLLFYWDSIHPRLNKVAKKHGLTEEEKDEKHIRILTRFKAKIKGAKIKL